MSESARKNAEWQYLLGQLSPEDEIRIENGFIANDVDFEQLEIAEDELIDAYARNELSPQDRRQFERKLLTSPRMFERVSFARALANKRGAEVSWASGQHYLDQKPTWWSPFFNKPSAFPTALASIAVVVIGAGLLLFGWRELRKESGRLEAERVALQKQKEESDKSLLDQKTKIEQTAADLQKKIDLLAEDRRELDQRRTPERQPGTRGLPGAIVSLVLSPGLLRDSNQPPALELGSGAETAQLSLLLQSNDYRSYRAIIKDARRRTVAAQSGLPARRSDSGYVINLSLPAKNLSRGNYLVTVNGRLPNGGWTDVNYYMFRVAR